VHVVMPDTYSSTASIATNIASWTKECLGNTGDIKDVICSMGETMYIEGYYTLAVTFDWPPQPKQAIKALGQACAHLGCASMQVSDPLNYGLPVHQAKPFYVTNDILGAALSQIRDNTKDILKQATSGRDVYTLHCDSLYSF
jgi:hypothetical protein